MLYHNGRNLTMSREQRARRRSSARSERTRAAQTLSVFPTKDLSPSFAQVTPGAGLC